MNFIRKIGVGIASIIAGIFVTLLVFYAASLYAQETMVLKAYMVVLFAHFCYSMTVLKAENRKLKNEIAMDNKIIAFQHAILSKQMEEEEEMEVEKATK